MDDGSVNRGSRDPGRPGRRLRNGLFALASLLALGALALAAWSDSRREWVRYQEEFLRRDRSAIGGLEGARGRRVELQQVTLEKLNRADRCTTCHLGVAEPRWASGEQPFRAHPEPALAQHPVERFGCTVCHGGQGLATTAQGAHGRPGTGYTGNGAEPLLPAEYVEASCGSCHTGRPLRSAPLLGEGQHLYRRLGCAACHEPKGFAQQEKIGPPLTCIGEKLRGAWLVEFLRDPLRYSAEARMPDFKLTEAQARALAAFLFKLGPPDAHGAPAKEPTPSPALAEVERGRRLVEGSACASCHTIRGVAAEGFAPVEKAGPELTGVGRKVKMAWLVRYLKDPASSHAATRMPRYRFTEEEAQAVATFLVGLQPEAPPPATSDESLHRDSALVAEGRRLAATFNCGGCHTVEGMPKGEMGPALDGIGSKPAERLDFGSNPQGIPRALPAWLMAKVTDPRSFRDTLKMPAMNATKEEARTLVTFLLGLTKPPVPEEYQGRETKAAPDAGPALAGRAGKLFRELQCLQCHRVGASGEVIGPDLTHVGTRLQARWLADYLQDPRPLRPALAARMPKFRLSPAEAKILASAMSEVLVDETLRALSARDLRLAPEEVKEAKLLFGRRLGCITCHRLGEKGGRIGPDLTGIADRMRVEWIVRYLRDPAKALPGSRMPNPGLEDEDLRLLAGYLLTFRGKPLAGWEGSRAEPRPPLPPGRHSEAAVRGRFLYEYSYCAACHGAGGKGDGYNAKHLPQFPRDYTDAQYMATKSDQDLMEGIKGGGRSVGLSVLLPAYGRTLSDREIQDLVAYIRTFPAGAKAGPRPEREQRARRPTPLLGWLIVGSPPPVMAEGGPTKESLTRKDSQGEVAVDVTYLDPLGRGSEGELAFEVRLNTHSVDLDQYALEKVAFLRDPRGREHAALRAEGLKGGGHHRAGTVVFPAKDATGQPLLGAEGGAPTILIRGVGGISERTFRWD